MKLLIDVCLSHELADLLKTDTLEVVHWSKRGAANAKDRDILAWAAENGHVIVSADLDFGDLLAMSDATLPSVILVRSDDQSPQRIAPLVRAALERFAEQLGTGCLISIDDSKARMRMLPLR
ncbi:MAG: DUF5615 family PIN-like protein [Flavobacteriales bacterium]